MHVLDRIDGCVGKGSDSSRDETDETRLPRRETSLWVLRLPLLQRALQLRVNSKVRCLICRLPECREGNSAVEGPGTFLAEDEEEGVGGVAVLGDVERVGHRVDLSLQANLNDLHRAHDEDSFRDSSSETGCDGASQHCLASESERRLPRKMLGELVFPVALFTSRSLYASKEANRMAILGTMPVTTAPSPL
jgi:hypothetical protein